MVLKNSLKWHNVASYFCLSNHLVVSARNSPGVLFNPNLSLQLVGKEKSSLQRGNTELSDQDGDNVTSNQSVSVIEQMIGQP